MIILSLISEDINLGSKIFAVILFALLVYVLAYFIFKIIEKIYVLKYRKPLYNHFYFYLSKLNKDQKTILKDQFSFYNKLTEQEKSYFEHRVSLFIEDKEFIGREGIQVTEEIKVRIASTAIMLTFGFRNFYIGFISKIVVYPRSFYSNINKAFHKGEFNPGLKALVLSWEDFKIGFDIEDDNLNLGIHEFTHAIHINSKKSRDVSSSIFNSSFLELSKMLSADEPLRKELIASDYFRTYAFTNQFEFLAVIVENFIETPKAFKAEFPEIYSKVKQMLNFNFASY